MIETRHELTQALAESIGLEQEAIRLTGGRETVDGAYSLRR
jgi:hypothetical protein